MATLNKNALENQSCAHSRAREIITKIDGVRICQRVCCACRKVLHVDIEDPTEFSRDAIATGNDLAAGLEDQQHPAYWDCSPDLRDVHGFETFRKLAWAIVAFAFFVAVITSAVAADFN